MSNKEMVLAVVDNLSEQKLGYVLAYLQGIYADESIDDVFCLELYNAYLKKLDKDEFVSIEQAAKDAGVNV